MIGDSDQLWDTSIWIDWYRGKTPASLAKDLSLALEENRVASCGVVLFELLRGARDEKACRAIRRDLASLTFLETPTEIFDRAGMLAQECGRKGKQVSFTDSLLASLATTHKLTLLTRDKDFKNFKNLNLMLV